jgi:hypothetical protein
VLGIRETFWRFRLRIEVGDCGQGADQAGILGLTPAFTVAVHTRTVTWFSGVNPSAVTFDHRHFGWTFRTVGQGVIGFGIGIAALSQFPAHIMHNPLDGLGRELLAPDLIEYDRAPLEGTCLRSRDDDPMDQERCQLTGIKPEYFPKRGKTPGGTWGKWRLVPRWRQNYQSISRTLFWEPSRSGYHTQDISRWLPDGRRSHPYATPGSRD